MKKIFLVLEDYNEMLFIETILKKVGFDCTGVQNDSNLSDKILTFSPHLVISDGFGRKINGLNISQKFKRQKGIPKLLLVMTPPQKIDEFDMSRLTIDGLVDRPIHPPQFIEIVSKILSIDAEPLKKKLEKLGLFQETAKDSVTVLKGKIKTQREQLVKLSESSISEAERERRYAKHLGELDEPKQDGLPRRLVIEQTKDFRNRENDPEIKEIDEERQAFVKALFKK